jgi:hypothetical protein
MTEATQNAPTRELSPLQECLKDRHFLAAAIILIVVWAGWTIIMAWLGMVFQKEPVPWAAGVEVHPTEFRMLSLATSFGPDNRFELAGDGELFYPRNGELFVTKSGETLVGKNGALIYRDRSRRQVFLGELSELRYKKSNEPVLDGIPDGERTIIDEVLETLAIGTPMDYSRVGDRTSAWYVSRTYIDRQKSKAQRYRLWQLDVTYYTGTMDKAPHFPERCLQAAGMSLGNLGEMEFDAPGAPSPWGDKPVTCRFVEYHNPRRGAANLHVQYYVYSMNGEPESSWQQVRLKTADPFGKYTYFAKIQFNPLNEVGNPNEAKQAAAEFVKYMLPEVLKMLPMPEDVKKLE